MHPVMRSALGLVAGAAVGFVLIAGIQALNQFIYPPPAGLDFNDRAAVAEFIALAPPGALLVVLAGYAVGTFAGAWVAAKVAGRAAVGHALVVGGLFLAAGVANVVMLPHPGWFTAASLAVFVPAAWLGGRLAGGGPGGEARAVRTG